MTTETQPPAAEQEPPSKQCRGTKPGCCGCLTRLVGLVVIVLILAACVTAWIENRNGRSAAAGVAHRLDELGLPGPGEFFSVDAELCQSPDNAAAWYDAAFKFLQQTGSPNGLICVDPSHGWQLHDAITDEQADQLAEAFDQYDFALSALHRAAVLDTCQFAADPTTIGFGYRTGAVRQAAYWLFAEAVYAAHQQDTTSATQSIVALLRMVENLQHEPTFLGEIMRYPTCAIALAALEDVCRRASLSGTDFARVETALASVDASMLPEGVTRKVALEYAYWSQHPQLAIAADHFRTELWARAGIKYPTMTGPASEFKPSYLPPMNTRFGQWCAHGWAIASPGAFRRRAAESASSALELHESMANLPDDDGRSLFALAQAWSHDGPHSWFARPTIICMRVRAQVRSARAAMYVARSKLESGEWPASLADAGVPTALFDPYTNQQPLRYRHTESGIVVYSIGENDADDEGENQSGRGPNGPRHTDDLAFRLFDQGATPAEHDPVK